jgi:CheY-like chemotaxis protein
MTEVASVGKAVFVVEDDPTARQGLSVILQTEGYTVATAEEGHAALESLREQPPPDLILLDMLTPVWDGWRFLAERDRLPDLRPIPVIIVSGIAMASREWAQANGCVGFVRKPIVIDELLAEIHRCLDPSLL